MRPRIAAARGLMRAGKFIESLAVAVMRPEDLVQFSRQCYSRPDIVEDWGRPDLVDEGLYPNEAELLEQIPFREGRLLVLGVGGGREAIVLARLGFDVTGMDFVPEMVERAIDNAAERGLRIEGLTQEVSHLEVPARSFDVIWLSAAMYSCVPTRKRRIQMLQRIGLALRPGGYFVCHFQRGTGGTRPGVGGLVRRLFAYVTLGNTGYQPGDTLWFDREFLHVFSGGEEAGEEFEEAGFEIISLHAFTGISRGGAVLRQPSGVRAPVDDT